MNLILHLNLNIKLKLNFNLSLNLNLHLNLNLELDLNNLNLGLGSILDLNSVSVGSATGDRAALGGSKAKGQVAPLPRGEAWCEGRDWMGGARPHAAVAC